MFVDVAEEAEYDFAMNVQSVLVIIQSCCHLGEIEVDDEVGVMLGSRNLSYV